MPNTREGATVLEFVFLFFLLFLVFVCARVFAVFPTQRVLVKDSKVEAVGQSTKTGEWTFRLISAPTVATSTDTCVPFAVHTLSARLVLVSGKQGLGHVLARDGATSLLSLLLLVWRGRVVFLVEFVLGVVMLAFVGLGLGGHHVGERALLGCATGSSHVCVLLGRWVCVCLYELGRVVAGTCVQQCGPLSSLESQPWCMTVVCTVRDMSQERPGV